MKKIIGVLGVACSLLLAGCASYQAANLTALDPEFVKEYEGLEGLAIGCKEFTSEDCITYLDRDVIAKGFQPIQFTFYNNTDQAFLFSEKSLSLPTVTPEMVAAKVQTSTIGRVLGYTVGALLLHPLIIPAVVDGVKSYKANQKLYTDFESKSRTHFVIAPHSYEKTLVFIPKEFFSPIFFLTLQEEKTGEEKEVKIISSL